MTIPAALVIISLFTVPKGWVETMQLGYLLITNVLLSAVIYTAICIPYASIMVVRTNSQEERGTMGIWRAAAGYVSGMIIAIAVIPITNALGGNQSACSFGNKVGSGIGASIIGWCLGLAAYDGLATTVSPAVIQAIYTFSIYIPLALFILLFLFAMKFDLEKRLPEIQMEIATRKK